MIRLFTGLAIPQNISTEISLLRGGLPGARWIDEADYHLTLQFAGNVEESIADDLHEALLRVRKSPVEVILDSLLVFGGAKARAIVIGARATPALLDLQANHERVLQRLGIAYDARKYVPHVTIARLKSMPAPAVAEFMNTRGYFRPVTFVVDEFILYSSGKSKGGGPYRVEDEYQLRE